MKKIKSEIDKIKNHINNMENSSTKEYANNKIKELDAIVNNPELVKLRGVIYVITAIENIKKIINIK